VSEASNSAQPHILMCPPDHYGIEYEINAWMDKTKQADRELAVQQWNGLREKLEAAGAKISIVDPVEGLPDMVFTANAGLVHHNRIVLSRFRPEPRRGEEPLFQKRFEANGRDVTLVPEDTFFEGAGDALFCGDTLVAGYRQRSDARGLQLLGEILDCRVMPLELIDPYYYHIDTCFCPMAPGVAMYFPGAFDDYGQRVLGATVDQLIEIEESEAKHFAANAVVVGKTIVTNAGCPNLHEKLRAAGYDPIETPLSEFVKAGGSAKCLTLRLDGEEAAQWKYVD
jgi:N-dimethylarginine dimethylaminohydrolase